MENEISDKQNFTNNIENFLKKNKKILISFLIFVVFIIVGIFSFNHYQISETKKISESYIKGGVYLSQNKMEKAKNTYKDIILKKDKFYSLLALNNIIENKLIKDNDEIIKLFEIVENVRKEKSQKDLVRLKKALFLLEISKNKEAKLIFDDLISSNSIWKEIAMQFSKIK
tara:strand:+ start:1795 stop:2307 length:513 start_codon:yes stop_codon:yes gene_type:complete